MSPLTVLVTGSAGYLGSQVVAALAARGDARAVALDVREPARRLDGVAYEVADIRAPEVDAIVARHRPAVVVHLASIVTPGKHSNRELEYSVDVGGTRNILEAALTSPARPWVIFASSREVYGEPARLPATEDAGRVHAGGRRLQ